MNKLFGAIEGGGTKFICAVGTSPDDIRRETRISTTTPEETLRGAISFFKDAEGDLGKLSSLGIATFGPIDPNPASPAYGFVLPTPKPGWSNANVLGMLNSAFDMPIVFELDVNGAALGEWTWGAARDSIPSSISPLALVADGGLRGGVVACATILPRYEERDVETGRPVQRIAHRGRQDDYGEV